MIRRLVLGTTAVVGLVTVPATAVAAPAAAPPPLRQQLDQVLADPSLQGATTDLVVRDAATGSTLYARNADTRLVPASNAKLYTSAAAMDLLGPDFRFRTTAATSGTRVGRVLQGNLYLKGYGDPTITAAGYDQLAASVAAGGITRVNGALVADDTSFDAERYAPFWSLDDTPYYYSAQTSALTVSPDDIADSGTVLINVTPAATVGAPPRVTVTPANSYVTVVNQATTGTAGSPRTVSAGRTADSATITVTGSIPRGSAVYASQPTVVEPTGLAADVFRTALARHGVTVTQPTQFAASPPTAAVVATRRSAPLSQVLVPFLKLSNNMVAEALTKAMGASTTGGQGTWADGTAAIEAHAAANGVDPADLQLYDGSGLGRADLTTGRATTNLLLALRSKPWFSTWYAALPVAGEPDQLVGGTLRNRMGGTAAAGNLHGKTGSLTGVSSLSGYVTDAKGRLLVFSMMSNGQTSSVTAVQDAVGVTLANRGSSAATVSSSSFPASTPATTFACSMDRVC